MATIWVPEGFDPTKPRTNFDAMRAMSAEELATWHEQYCPNRDDIDMECQKESCEQCWLDWLRQEADNGESN